MRVKTNIDASGRNRQRDYGGPEQQSWPEVDESQLAGNLIDVAAVGQLVVDGIQRNQLYLFPHPESREFIRRRFERIDQAFARERVRPLSDGTSDMQRSVDPTSRRAAVMTVRVPRELEADVAGAKSAGLSRGAAIARRAATGDTEQIGSRSERPECASADADRRERAT
jgi:hypothetical protein